MCFFITFCAIATYKSVIWGDKRKFRERWISDYFIISINILILSLTFKMVYYVLFHFVMLCYWVFTTHFGWRPFYITRNESNDLETKKSHWKNCIWLLSPILKEKLYLIYYKFCWKIKNKWNTHSGAQNLITFQKAKIALGGKIQ